MHIIESHIVIGLMGMKPLHIFGKNGLFLKSNLTNKLKSLCLYFSQLVIDFKCLFVKEWVF